MHLLVSLSTLAVAQCPRHPVNGDANEVVCDSTILTSIPDCVVSDVTTLYARTPSIPLEASTFERFTALTRLSIGYFETPVIAKDMLKYLGYLQNFEIFRTDVDYIDTEWFMFSRTSRRCGCLPTDWRIWPRTSSCKNSCLYVLILLLVSLSTLVVAQCLCHPVNGDANEVVCDSTTLTSIPDCVTSDVTTLYVRTPSIPLEASTFERFTALTRLSIGYFETPVIAKDMLKYLGFLQYFEIFRTDVNYIDNEWFMFSPHITTLWLSSNRLAYLAPDTFLYLPRLETVYLHNNQMMSLTPALFKGTSLTTLYLNDNPWHCDCELATFVLWMQETGVQTGFYAHCSHPDDLQGLNINNLTTSLVCK